MYLQQISIIGHLGKDPTSNQVNGKTVCNFNVGVSHPKTKTTNWYRVAVWGQLAEPCMKFLSKGKAVFVMGELGIKEWERQGTPDKQLEIHANTVQFLSPHEAKEAPIPKEPENMYHDIPF